MGITLVLSPDSAAMTSALLSSKSSFLPSAASLAWRARVSGAPSIDGGRCGWRPPVAEPACRVPAHSPLQYGGDDPSAYQPVISRPANNH